MDDAHHPLKRWRDKNGLTQAELAMKLGIGGSQISMIEAGRRGASVETAVKIVKLTKGNVPLESLVPPTPRPGAAA